MGNLSDHFSVNEFACRCGCGFSSVSPKLIALLESIRSNFNAPVNITSGCRCAAHNRAVGGVANSQHLQGTAADISVTGYSPAAVYRWINQTYPDTLGLGCYATFVHVDVRASPARWHK